MKIIPGSLCLIESIYFVISVTFNKLILHSFIQSTGFSDGSEEARVPSGEAGEGRACLPPPLHPSPLHTHPPPPGEAASVL